MYRHGAVMHGKAFDFQYGTVSRVFFAAMMIRAVTLAHFLNARQRPEGKNWDCRIVEQPLIFILWMAGTEKTDFDPDA